MEEEDAIIHRVSFYLISELRSADEISAVLGLPFSRQFRKGDKRSGTILVHQKNFWILDSNVDAKLPFREHILHLLNVLTPFRGKLKEVMPFCEAQCTCIAHGKSTPELTFDADLLFQLGEMGADLDIDLYIDPAEG
jgi:hypothetical protein